ncbi:MAG: choice-of-anchor D domain-containing protein, partial [Planctomycetota bacterium]|nr:choice-of-anchor D domain-containing protein [Planctomycetota bacterium]
NDNPNYNINDGTGAAGQGQGDYQLTVTSSNPDADGVIQGALRIDLTNPDELDPSSNLPAVRIASDIGTDANPINPGGARVTIGNTDVDVYSMVAPDTGIVTVNVNAREEYGVNGVNSFVKILDANGNVIASNDDENALNTDSFMQFNVIEGRTYYLALTTYGNRDFDPSNPYNRVNNLPGTGLYSAYVSFSNGDVNGTALGAAPFQDFQVNGTVQGTIGADFGQALQGAGTNGGYKDVDFFRYTSPGLGVLAISATSPSMNSAVGVWYYDAVAKNIVEACETTGAAPTLMLPIDAGRTIWISVTGRGNQGFNWFATASGSGGETGTYALSTRFLTVPEIVAANNDSTTSGTPNPLALNSPLSAQIGEDGPLQVGGTDIDLYTFTPTQSRTYNIVADASAEGGADTFLRVFDSAGQELAYNDDINDSIQSSLITMSLSAGQTYYIGVCAAGAQARSYTIDGTGDVDGDTGSYNLAVLDYVPPTVTIVATDAQAAETGLDPGLFTVTRTGLSATGLTVNYSIATGAGMATNGSDYGLLSGSVTIPAGKTSATVSIAPIDDIAIEGTEKVRITLSSNAAYVLGAQAVAEVSLADNDGPTLVVLGKSIAIAPGDTTPSAADDTDFGSVQARAQSGLRTFTLANSGAAALTLTGAKVQIVGANPGDFLLTAPSASALAVGASTTFTVAFKPLRLGLRTATVRVTSNDPDHPTYDFTIKGFATTDLFSEGDYLRIYPDVAANVGPGKAWSSGYAHFAAAGQGEGRLPNYYFDPTSYLRKNADVAPNVGAGKTWASGFEHFAYFGQIEGRTIGEFYDEATYRARNPDVAANVGAGKAWSSGFEHFLAAGQFEGRQFCKLFDEQLYRYFNPDVAANIGPGKWRSGFEHFIFVGFKEGRRFFALYDEATYLAKSPDVAANVGVGKGWATGLSHFRAFGYKESRQYSPYYFESAYLTKNPDIRVPLPWRTGLEHYLLYGWFEGRVAI